MDAVTRPSLVASLRDTTDHAAWEKFLGLYGGMIRGYALRKGCSEAPAGDVLQETMVRLLRRMPEFTYQPGSGHPFRSYLLRIAHGCIVDHFRREGRYVSPQPSQGAPGQQDILESLPDEDTADPGSDGDRAWLESVLARAWGQVRGKIRRETEQAFLDYAVKGDPAEAVAERYGVSRNTLYQQAFRVQELLRREVRAVLADAGEDDLSDEALIGLLGRAWEPGSGAFADWRQESSVGLEALANATLTAGSLPSDLLREQLVLIRDALRRSPPPAARGWYLVVCGPPEATAVDVGVSFAPANQAVQEVPARGPRGPQASRGGRATVPPQGARAQAETCPPTGSARWCALRDSVVIGSGESADICLEARGVSRRHARLDRHDDGWTLVDLDSTNGSHVNGTRVTTQPLLEGDIIHLGEAMLVLLVAE